MVTSLSFDHMTGENREYPEMQVNEMHTPYDKHHKVSSFLKSHQNSHNSVKYEVL